MLARTLMLKAAGSRALVRFISRVAGRYGLARRFIAGESRQEAIEVVRRLNSIGIRASLDLLGEGVEDEEEARRATGAYIELLQSISAGGVDSNISIKLTQLGLDIDRRLAASNLERILAQARKVDNFVRIDMEDSHHTEATLALFEEAWGEFGGQVGIVIQAYLYRSRADVERLARLGCNVRLCKGAYMEPPEVAFPSKKEVDSSYRELLGALLGSPAYTAIATHDDRMIEHAQGLIRERGLERSRYEYQMLYGIRRERQRALCRQGERVRVYVPFGSQWAPYFIRRLAERPANVIFLLKNVFR